MIACVLSGFLGLVTGVVMMIVAEHRTRDYFAAQAETAQFIAERAYWLADAMLKARDK